MTRAHLALEAADGGGLGGILLTQADERRGDAALRLVAGDDVLDAEIGDGIGPRLRLDGLFLCRHQHRVQRDKPLIGNQVALGRGHVVVGAEGFDGLLGLLHLLAQVVEASVERRGGIFVDAVRSAVFLLGEGG
ncbi:hypothetical protein, partial [Rhizobium leguminosarum]|uniref:hypothetical protein n=1 Tax=Rhizobium leguminosarum TaxID=384 RepID=UPI0019D481A0